MLKALNEGLTICADDRMGALLDVEGKCLNDFAEDASLPSTLFELLCCPPRRTIFVLRTGWVLLSGHPQLIVATMDASPTPKQRSRIT